MPKYVLTMELIINAYAIVDADSEEEATKKGNNLTFDCNLVLSDNYGKVLPVVPFYYGEVGPEVTDIQLYGDVSEIQSMLQEERFQRALRKDDMDK